MTFYVVGFISNLCVLAFLLIVLAATTITDTGLATCVWIFMFVTTGLNLVRWAEKFLEGQIVALARLQMMQSKRWPGITGPSNDSENR